MFESFGGLPRGGGAWASPPSSASAAGISSAVDRLAAAVSDVVQAPVASSGLTALAEASVVIHASIRLRSAAVARLADVEQRGLVTTLDPETDRPVARSMPAWVAALGPDLPAADVALARRLPSLPHVSRALVSGRVGPGAAGRVAAEVSRVRVHLDRPDGLIDGQPGDEVVEAVLVDGVRSLVCEQWGGVEPDDPRLLALGRRLDEVVADGVSQADRVERGFLVAADHLDAATLPRALRLLTALLPECYADRVARAEARRALHLTELSDGTGWVVRGRLTCEAGALLATVLDAELHRNDDAPVDTAAAARLRAEGVDPGDEDARAAAEATPAPGPVGEHPADRWPRSRSQRLHDALASACRRFLGADLAGVHDKAPVTVVVTVPAQRLAGRPGAPSARTIGGAPVPDRLLQEWMCDSAVLRLVMGLGGRVVQHTHTARTLTATERRVKLVETGARCQVRGCGRGHDRPGTSLVPHHVTPWASTGLTSLPDTVLLCGLHHHDLHLGRHVLTLGNGGAIHHTGWVDPPPGWSRPTLRVPPPPATSTSASAPPTGDGRGG